jgi:universal stress protein A
MAALRKILVPLDGSEPSLAALEHAITLALESSATVEILHVLSARETLSLPLRADADRAMEAAVDRARDALGTRISRNTVAGDPVREIVERAGRGIDLIVIGTHGRTGRLHALLGSITEAVVRNAPCPVLTVRDPGPGYQSFAERRHGRPSLAEQVEAQVRGRDG